MTSTITLKEAFTINEVSGSIKQMGEAIRGYEDVIVDATSVTRVDTAAIQMLISAHKEGLRLGHKVTLKNSNPIIDLLSVMGIKLNG